MKTLREEIENYIENKLFITNDSLPYHTDKILKLIEERIDEVYNDKDIEKNWDTNFIFDRIAKKLFLREGW